MTCPKCKANDSAVKQTRQRAYGVWRRRFCMGCGHVFTTRDVGQGEIVIQKGGNK